MTKYVSLTEALRSGKRFRIIQNGIPQGDWIVVKNYNEFKCTVNEILHAECEIEREPREIWVPEFQDKLELSGHWYDSPKQLLVCYPNVKARAVKFREVLESEE